MKIRNGFVSNSSSSNFIVAVKTEEKVTKPILLDLLGIPIESQGAMFFDRILSAIANGDIVEQTYNPVDVNNLFGLKRHLADLRLQLEQTEKEFAAETDKSTPFASGLRANLSGLKAEISEWESDIQEMQQAMNAGLPGGQVQEPGWTLLSVSTDNTEGIYSLGCDVIRVTDY